MESASRCWSCFAVAWAVVLALSTQARADEDAVVMAPGDAAAAVLGALEANEPKSLAVLAGSDQPDPWLVVDALCALREHDAALTFVEAAPRRETAALPKYIAMRRDAAPETEARSVLTRLQDARTAADRVYALAMASTVRGPFDSVPLVRVAHERAHVLAADGRLLESVKVLGRAGDAALALGWMSRARTIATARLASAREWGDPGLTFLALRDLGRVLEALGDADAAVAHFRKALGVLSKSGDDAAFQETVEGLGDLYLRLRQFSRAQAEYQRALNRARVSKEEDGVALARIIDKLGLTDQGIGNHEDSLRFFNTALKVGRMIEDEATVAVALEHLGGANAKLARHAVALGHYEESLRIFRAMNDRGAVARVLAGIGSVHAAHGQLPLALEHYGAALKIRREEEDRRGVADALIRVGDVYRRLGKLAESLQCYSESLGIIGSVGDPAATARVLGALGATQEGLKNDAAALEHYAEALAVGRATSDPPDVSRMLQDLGRVQTKLGRHADALSNFEAALRIETELGDEAGMAEALHRTGQAHASLHAYAKALAILEQSLELKRDLDDDAGAKRVLEDIAAARSGLGK